MVLVGNTHDAASGKMVVNRISWTPQAEGTVRQHWETSTDGGKSWTTAFDGRYARK
jgi:hypothetical protein